jgi:hypothetical protein
MANFAATRFRVLPYDWQVQYRAALMETNPARLKTKIEVAEAAMDIRAHELTGSENDMERVAMRDATSALRTLRRQIPA